MCGILGYIGKEQVAPLLLKGLEKLEYRGYDSAGVAILDGERLNVTKTKGRLKVLSELLKQGKEIQGTVGIGHTRWATHGEPSDVNSHPHLSESGKFAVVHNGIIENYLHLRDFLADNGKKFLSETDSEVIAQLLEYYDTGDLLETVIKVKEKLEGSYALGIICRDNPDRIVAVRKDSPLIIGVGRGENFIASDITAIVSKTKTIIRLKDGEIAILEAENIKLYDKHKTELKKDISTIDWNISEAKKEGYEHFMFKEIMEQPKVIGDTISPRIRDEEIILDKINLSKEYLENINKIYIIGCGSAFHVGCIAKYIFEKLLRKSVEVDIASEFRYRDPIVNKDVLVIAISQSGETADTLAAVRESRKLGARVLSIVNVVGSSIANESDDVIYTWAGPEIAVATTKAFSTQLAIVYLLALYMSKKLGKIENKDYFEYIAELLSLSSKIETILKEKENIREFALDHYSTEDVFFIGRNLDYALSLEGSLKFKEISYIHSEAYAAGELKHGTISLIEKGTLVVAIAAQDALVEKMISNIKEVKARGARVLGITTQKNADIKKVCDFTFCIPEICNLLKPSLTLIPLQLLAYYVASERGCDIDKPRNLAKSVTVE
ncbi:MAG: glutamine--fructose-6-phosphate transaminase (isomerizing) [Oscillospiraceae bacterium]|jgi:glucosamine--fructose-6-phosphate aminotransferase (isomerizing)|nr:glutamine--fructose-6-phosphate transaminase (isomerizing) [Oscillospiraceae bacterium]